MSKGIYVPPTYSGNGRRTEGYGTLGVISGERGTYASFWNDMHSAHLTMLTQDPRNKLTVTQGVDVAGNCNTLCRGMVGDWLWIMGDDHAFAPDLLPRLLAHDVDVVVPHCLKRNPPWDMVVYSHRDEDGYYAADYAELPEDELVEIHAAGSAGMLIRRHVLEAIGDPWFTPAPDAVGLNEDVWFCEKVHAAGFKIYCDTGALLGHISTYTVYPQHREDGWHIEHVYDQHTRIPITRLVEAAVA